MSDERFYLGNNGTTICDRSQGGSDGFNMLTIFKVVDLLNEQQATIRNEQQATIRKLQDLCGKSDGENAKLRMENKKLKAKLKEKEEDEQLYANEIVELRKTNEEWLQFKELGGDY